MQYFKFTSNEAVQRLRWLMLCVIIFDIVLTLAGQPSSFWHHPETVIEGNDVVRYFFSRGLSGVIPFILVYCIGAFLAASILPRRLALSVIMFFLFVHYDGACTWLVHHFQLRTKATAFYGIPLSVIFVWLAFPASARDLNQKTPNEALHSTPDDQRERA